MFATDDLVTAVKRYKPPRDLVRQRFRCSNLLTTMDPQEILKCLLRYVFREVSVFESGTQHTHKLVVVAPE